MSEAKAFENNDGVWAEVSTRRELAKAEFEAALAAAQAAMDAVSHDGKVNFGNTKYSYSSSEHIIGDTKKTLADHGLSFRAVSYRVSPPLAEGTPLLLDATYRIGHKGGHYEEFKSQQFIIPERGRPFDKALGAAKTSDLGYSLRGYMMIPRGLSASDDIEQRDDTKYAPGKKSAPRKQQPKTMAREDMLGIFKSAREKLDIATFCEITECKEKDYETWRPSTLQEGQEKALKLQDAFRKISK